MKLKAGEIKKIRDALLAAQGNRCAICGQDCSADPVLDHDHKTGYVRAVLHRGCNALLGRVERNAARHGVSREELPGFLAGASTFLNAHSTAQTPYLHPTHRTQEEAAELRRKRAKKQRALRRAKQELPPSAVEEG